MKRMMTKPATTDHLKGRASGTFVLTGVLVLALGLSACSATREARRPEPVDLGQFQPGAARITVVQELGPPAQIVQDGANSCDQYQLFTDGRSAGGKGAIMAGEILVGIATLGISEAIFVPVEAATQEEKHLVTICYDGNGVLRSIGKSNAVYKG